MTRPMPDQERYETVDLPFYRAQVAPVLPERVLDFHAHIWRPDHWRDAQPKGTPYMATDRDYGAEALMRDAARQFPDRPYSAVVFGQPTPAADPHLTNGYAAACAGQPGLCPLRVTGRSGPAGPPPTQLRREMAEGPFFGYKVCIPWVGDDYGRIGVEDMIGPAQMEVAAELGLVVLLHVPGPERLADAKVQRAVAQYARRYANARIVLAHCGRCYHPERMRPAVQGLRDLENVYLDTAMVMDVSVLQMVFEQVGSARVVFGTDLPVAAMRGRRVYVMDHWVDVVLEGYPASAYRVSSDRIRATFMTWEIVLAIRRAAELAGLAEAKLRDVFYENGMALLRHVTGGKKLTEAQRRWSRREP